MPNAFLAPRFLRAARGFVRAVASGPQMLAFLPALSLGAFWLGGEPLLMFAAFALPAIFAAGGAYSRAAADLDALRVDGGRLPPRTAAIARIEALLAPDRYRPGSLAVLAIGLDDARDVETRLGPAALAQVLARIGTRIASSVRASDLVADLDDGAFAVVVTGARRTDLETLLELCARIQAVAAEPVNLDGARVYISVSVGIGRPEQLRACGGEGLLAAAELALAEARGSGQNAVRVHAEGARPPARPAPPLADEIAEAIVAGHILPWFQPQVRTTTGAVTGAEALARWTHPRRGLIPPAEFLGPAEEAGLSERLGAAILHRSLSALRSWDLAGVHVPRVSVNFATPELRNPGLVEKVRWELDRFDLAPGRLTVEVLETVIAATGDDTVVRNLSGLAALGCGIDLDDFGTGHAAIGNIRRFSVQRVKIDRSFVTRLDTDSDQQTVISAILLMAERLRLDTLAEGVETAAEHATLARLGCGHVQGFAVARPMPEKAFREWVLARGPLAGTVPAAAPEVTAAGLPAGSFGPGKTA